MTAALLAQAHELVATGAPKAEVALALGVSRSVLYAALQAEGGVRAPSAAAIAAPAVPSGTETPLELARGLLASNLATIGQLAKTEPGSPRLNPARGEARALTKLIAALEVADAGKETPEQVERRRRREDGETVEVIRRYVDQELTRALRPTADAPHGHCPKCMQALTVHARASLMGATPAENGPDL